MNISNIEKELLKLLNIAIKKKEVPVAALIIYKNKIIGRGYNLVEKTNDVTAHAEIIALKNASKKLRSWKLSGCKMYVTLEPCNMCKNAIEASRIEEVVYFINKNEKKGFVTNFIKGCQTENTRLFSQKLKEFFENIRK